MATATPPPPPTVPLMTAEEFALRYGSEHVELIDGVVEVLPVAQQRHGKICFRAAQAVGNYADAKDCGHVTINDSFVRTLSDPDRVRGADVSYFSYARLPKGKMPKGLLSVSPDLIFEVRSPTDRWEQILKKISEYLSVGVTVVILVDEATESATVYRSEAAPQSFGAEQEMTVPDILPGFSLLVGKLFE